VASGRRRPLAAAPRLPLPVDELQSGLLSFAPGRFQHGQGGRKVQRRYERQSFSIEQAKEKLGYILALGVLARAEVRARVVSGSWLHKLAGIERTAFGQHREHQAV